MGQSIQLQDVVIGVTYDTSKAVQTAAQYFLKGMNPSFLFYWEQDEAARFTLVEFPAEILQPQDVSRFIGATFWELEEGLMDPQSNWEHYCEKYSARMPIRDFTVCRMGPDEDLLYFCITGMPVYSPFGDFCGYCGVVCDVTREQRIERHKVIKERLAAAFPRPH